MLTDRQIIIFKAIVDAFVNTAEPVGSKYLLERFKLPYSSATIRNEMAKLEEMGYLEKTHVSSGRIPSIKGYQLYAAYSGKKEIDDQVKNQVQQIFSSRGKTLSEIVHESCQMLSELTHLTTVALGPDARFETLQRITIVPISKDKVSVIIVTSEGHVENRTFILGKEYSLEDLNSCVDIMNDMLIGTPINQVIIRLEKEVKPLLAARIHEHEVLFKAFLEAFVKFASKDVYFSGKENMIYQPEFNDVNKLRRLISAFENAQTWNLIGVDQQEGVTVKIGERLPNSDVQDVSIISSSFKTGNEQFGSISVIGPTRMPYEEVVSLVDYISKNIENLFLDEEE